jgi:endo-1,4-beta-xylanase
MLSLILRGIVLLSLFLCAIPAGAQNTPIVVNLWPAGSPTLQGANEKETTNPPNPEPGQRFTIRNVHTPTLEVHLASADKANGVGIIVAPGGGHRELVWFTEGRQIAEWLNGLGITVFILKYRLAQTPGYKYTVEGEALQDTQRALRLVRSRATEWKVDPARIGLLGFSAGGALAAYADIRFDRGKADATDPIDRQSSRPDFVGLVYPGWGKMDTMVPKDAAPAFLTSAGSDDQLHARQTIEFFNMMFAAGVPADLHIYARGGHGGGIRPRNGMPFETWHLRFEDWLKDIGMLKKPESAASAKTP